MQGKREMAKVPRSQSERPAALLSRALGVALLVATAACGSEATPHSGVRGLVTLGPNCPVVRSDTLCPDSPYEAELVVLDADGDEVKRVRSEQDGSYEVALKPGVYRMVPQSPPGLPLPFASEFAVTVRADEWVTVDIAYDSGIR